MDKAGDAEMRRKKKVNRVRLSYLIYTMCDEIVFDLCVSLYICTCVTSFVLAHIEFAILAVFH